MGRSEWEEAVELDKVLEQERNAYSLQRLVAKQDDQYSNYVSQIANPQLKNMSSGVGGILGSSGSASPYFSGGLNGSLPDLKQSKRDALEAELLQPHANTVAKKGVGAGGRRF